MKKRLFFTLLILMCATGCSKKERSDNTLSILVYKDIYDMTSAYVLDIDLNNYTLKLAEEALYDINKENISDYSDIYPQYMSSEILILRAQAVNSNREIKYSVNDDNVMYYENYTLEIDKTEYKFDIKMNENYICRNINLAYDGKNINPASFFIDKDENIAIIGMTSASLEETQMVTMLFSNKNDNYVLESYYEYSTVWIDYDISNVNCPIYFSNYSNVTVNLDKGCFLYNETGKLFTISPYDGKIKCILDEKQLKKDFPYFDFHREFYSLFNYFVFQNNYCVATFPALDSLPGRYAVIYSETGKFKGYIVCNSEGISLFNEKDKETDKISSPFLPLIYCF